MKQIKKIQFISLLTLILIWIASIHYAVYKQPEKILANTLAIEYYKVGGIENYNKILEITKKQNIEWLKQYESQNWQVQAPNNNDPKAVWPTMSLEQAKKVTKEWTHILWNRDATITWIEYSDFNCFYCKKLHNAWTIWEVLKDYEWKVNFVFKQFPIQPNAWLKAEASLCAWNISWSTKYYEFIELIFNNTPSNAEEISKLWASIWIDETKLLSCIQNGTFKEKAKAEMAEGKSFGVTWTPWNILINNETGKWDKLSWAYPTASFKEKIDSLLK